MAATPTLIPVIVYQHVRNKPHELGSFSPSELQSLLALLFPSGDLVSRHLDLPDASEQLRISRRGFEFTPEHGLRFVIDTADPQME
jgi:hypothetical protein